MKFKILTLIVLIAFVQTGFCQSDTTIYLAANNKPATKKTALVRIAIKKITNEKFELNTQHKYYDTWSPAISEIITIIDDLTLKSEIVYSSNSKKKITRTFEEYQGNYKFHEYNEKLNLIREGVTRTKFPLYLEGEVKNYYSDGGVSSIEIYKNNQLQSNERWLLNGEKDIDNVFSSVDELPEFPGGDLEFRKYIARNVRYPNVSRKSNLQGKVYVAFVVDVTGYVIGGRLARGLHPLLDEAALEVVKSMPIKWKPGMLDGKKVRVAYTIPINFQLR